MRDACGGVLTPFFKVVTLSGNFGVVFIVAGVIMLFFRRTRKLGVCSLLALLFGMLFTNITLKNSVARPRPFSDATSEFYSLWKAAGSLKESGYSFPSGHSSASFASAVSIVQYARYRKQGIAAVVLSALIAISRMYVFVHFPTDVLTGTILGIIEAILAGIIVRFIYRKMEEKKTKIA